MTERLVAKIGALSAICLSIAIGASMSFGRVELRFTESQIQQKLAERIPMTQQGVTITDASVVIGEREMAIAFSMTGKRLTQPFTLTATADGTLAYRSGEFFFHPSQVRVIEMRVGDGRMRDQIRSLAERWADGEARRKSLIDAAPRIEAAVTATVERAAIVTLTQIPVYRVKDDAAGLVLRTALESVRIERRELVAVVSVVQLTFAVFAALAAALAAVGVLIVLVRTPRADDGGGGRRVG